MSRPSFIRKVLIEINIQTQQLLCVQARNKISLRNLSMILRQEKVSSAQQRSDNIEKGVAYAKEAVQLDTNDGTSWAVLGNAYLSAFFAWGPNPQTLKLCMSAYQQAVSYLKEL
jgi:cytochrome c-type biogenesis protein CcmH/NrfG